MVYTGDSCAATSHNQEPSKVTCSGDPGFDPDVYIVSRDPSGKQVWFAGDVALGGSFDINALSAGKTRLKGSFVAEPRVRLGAALAELGRPGEAEKELREALRLAPESPGAEELLAGVLFDAGRYSESAALYRRCVGRGRDDLRPRLAAAEARARAAAR